MPRQAIPSKPIQVVASAAVTTSSSSGNLKGSANAIPLCDAVTLFLDVTALSATSGVTTIDFYIDSSPDGGTTWYPNLHFAQVGTSTNIQKAEMRTIGVGPSEIAVLTNLGSAITHTSTGIVNTVLSPDHRVRWAFNATPASPTCTFALWAIALPFGTYAS